MAVTDYKVVTAPLGEAGILAIEVAAAIAEGFQPLGGIAASDHQFVQAMIKGTSDNGGGGEGGAVDSVNGMTGVVVLEAADVGALPDTYAPAWGDVTGKPAVIAAGADAAAARTAIGAGTPYSLPNAAAAVRGGVLQGAAVEDSIAEDITGVNTKFNELLASLRASGALAGA